MPAHLQEAKAAKAIEALQKLTQPHTKVIRGGVTKLVERYASAVLREMHVFLAPTPNQRGRIGNLQKMKEACTDTSPLLSEWPSHVSFILQVSGTTELLEWHKAVNRWLLPLAPFECL